MAGGNRAGGGRDSGAWALATVAAALSGVLLALGLLGATGSFGPRPEAAAPTAPRPAPAVPASTVPATPVPATTAPVTAAGSAGSAGATRSSGGPVDATTAPGPQPAVGQCLARRERVTGVEVAVVDCAAPHHYEVAGLVDAGRLFSTAPTEVEWRALLSARCPDRMRAYVGERYDPAGILTLRVTAPSAAEWAAGDRVGECLVTAGTGSDGLPVETTGPVSELDQSPPTATGACLAQATRSEAAATAVACSEPHQLQVVAAVDLRSRFEHYPTDGQWVELDGECRGPAVARHGESLRAPSGRPLVPTMVRIPVGSWLAGRRHTACAVGEVDPSGRLATTTTDLGH